VRQSETHRIGHTAEFNRVPTGDRGPAVSLLFQVLLIFGRRWLILLASPGPEAGLLSSTGFFGINTALCS
jgi:hypothetical protein